MDEVVFVSDDARRSFLDIYDLDPQKCTVLYNLIDKKEIQKLAESCIVDKSKFTICMVGRLNQQKRYDRALETMKLLKAAGYDAELWILGIGELETELKEKAKALGVSEMCDFKGFVRPAYPYMKVADVFLNTSEAEGYPLVLCEALCLGLPVVATDITGAHEILEESKYGLLVKEDVNDIYLGLRKIIDDAELRSAYARKSVQRSEMFSVEEVLKEIDAVL
jgi:glycosyltransferase involved in cell wall biosynthesis